MKRKGYTAIGIALLAAGFALVSLRDEVGQFLLAGAQVIPFIVLAALAQLADVARTPERRLWARALTWIWLLLLIAAFGLFSAGLAAVSLFGAGNEPSPSQIALLAVFVPLSLLVALPVLFGGVRRAIARRLPLNAGSLAETVALLFTVYFVVAGFAQLAVVGGHPVLLTVIESTNQEDLLRGRSEAGQILDLLYGLAWMLPLGIVAAGFPIRRRFADTLVRLGFVTPSRRQVAFGVGAAVALVGLMTGFDAVVSWLWPVLGWPTTDAEAFNKLLGAGISPVGAVAIGISAGVGEEVLTRGLLQPRFGKILPNLAFTAAHAFQYGADALLAVFLIGLILAFVRSRTNTTTAAIVHGLYDFILVMLAVLSL